MLQLMLIKYKDEVHHIQKVVDELVDAGVHCVLLQLGTRMCAGAASVWPMATQEGAHGGAVECLPVTHFQVVSCGFGGCPPGARSADPVQCVPQVG